MINPVKNIDITNQHVQNTSPITWEIEKFVRPPVIAVKIMQNKKKADITVPKNISR